MASVFDWTVGRTWVMTWEVGRWVVGTEAPAGSGEGGREGAEADIGGTGGEWREIGDVAVCPTDEGESVFGEGVERVDGGVGVYGGEEGVVWFCGGRLLAPTLAAAACRRKLSTSRPTTAKNWLWNRW